MKNNDIKKLLEKYAEGNLDANELQELESATHRNEVMQSAVGMASQIRKKRIRNVSYLVSMLVLVCGVGLFMRPLWMDEDKVQIAQLSEEKVPVETEMVEPMVEEETICVVENKDMETKVMVKKTNEEPSTIRVEQVTPQETTIAPMEMDVDEAEMIQYDVEPQVLCNVQCDADSVISEVWDFLKV